MLPVLAFVLLTATACDGQTPAEPGSSLTASELRAVPTSVQVGGVRLTLKTSLWRDFMPISPPDGKPLIAVATVQAPDGSVVPSRVRATDLWVVRQDEVWRGVPKEERPRAEMSREYEVVARGGPKWDTEVTVDVIVRLTHGDRTWLLRAADQRIEKTW